MSTTAVLLQLCMANLKLNTMQLETPGINHCCLMAIVYGQFKIEYHAVGDTWCQPLLSYGNCVWPI